MVLSIVRPVARFLVIGTLVMWVALLLRLSRSASPPSAFQQQADGRS